MSRYAVVTSINQTDLLPADHTERCLRQSVGLSVEDFDDIKFRGIPDPPAGTRMIVGEGSEVGASYGAPADWQRNVNGMGWCLHTRTGVAY